MRIEQWAGVRTWRVFFSLILKVMGSYYNQINIKCEIVCLTSVKNVRYTVLWDPIKGGLYLIQIKEQGHRLLAAHQNPLSISITEEGTGLSNCTAFPSFFSPLGVAMWQSPPMSISEESLMEIIWMLNVITGTPPGFPTINHTHLWNGSAAPAWHRCGMCQGNLHSHWQCDLIVITGSWH